MIAEWFFWLGALCSMWNVCVIVGSLDVVYMCGGMCSLPSAVCSVIRESVHMRTIKYVCSVQSPTHIA